MTFTDYLIRNFGLDLRQSAQIMALLLFLCGFGWMGLWFFLRRRITALRDRARRYDELAGVYEVRMHAKEHGLGARLLQDELVAQLAARGFKMQGIDIREVLDLALQERYRRGRGMVDAGVPGWWQPLNNVLEKGSGAVIAFAGCLLAVDYWHMMQFTDELFDSGALIGGFGIVFMAFAFISHGKIGGMTAMLFTLLVFHTTIGLVRPTVARVSEQFYRDYRESQLPAVPPAAADSPATPGPPR